jgi:serine/threonine protein kinase
VSLAPGTRLAPDEILAPLGAGGMGEVYRARDGCVDRAVALKVLPEEFFESEERRVRFGREAKLLASLTHPGLATLCSFEEIPGPLAGFLDGRGSFGRRTAPLPRSVSRMAKRRTSRPTESGSRG